MLWRYYRKCSTVYGCKKRRSYTTNWFGVNPNNLAAGTYNVSVTDIQGSSGSTTYTINEPKVSNYIYILRKSIEGYKWRYSRIHI